MKQTNTKVSNMRIEDKNWLIGFVTGTIIMYCGAKLDLYILSESHHGGHYNYSEGQDKLQPHGKIELKNESSNSNKCDFSNNKISHLD
jgi:hypothetical protein